MDFEAFKKQFELFTKIDSPEKLDICKKQYKNYFQQKEDDSYFEPLEKKHEDSLTGAYERNLKNILGFEQVHMDEIYFFVKPSFESEYLFMVQKKEPEYALILKEIVGSYWQAYYQNPSLKEHRTVLTQNTLHYAMGAKLWQLLNKTMYEARAPKAGRWVIDGVVYSLSKRTEAGIKAVTKHSPTETSRSGKIICLMEKLASYTKNNKQETLSEAMIQLEELS